MTRAQLERLVAELAGRVDTLEAVDRGGGTDTLSINPALVAADGTINPASVLESRTAIGNHAMLELVATDGGLADSRRATLLLTQQAGGADIVRTLLDAGGRSSFLQLVGVANVRIQYGRFAFALGPGENDVNIPLPSAWPNSHLAFVCQCWPNTSWDFVQRGAFPIALGNGVIHINQGYGLGQNYEASFLSIGT